MSKRHVTIPIFVPHKGCPNDCIFCNQKKISGELQAISPDKIINTIESHLRTIRDPAEVEVGFFGGSFTGIERKEQEMYLEIVSRYIEKGLIKKIRLSTRPDYISEEILIFLKKYNVKVIELGVQSLCSHVLEKSNRGHTTSDVYRASELIKKNGFSLGIQTMVGLPGSCEEKELFTAQEVIGIGPQFVRIYPTLVVRDTHLEKMYRDGEYKPIGVNEAVDVCARLLNMYRENQIDVIRVGLLNTENINDKCDVVAGPFHPAFGQLVESKLFLQKIEKIVEDKKLYAFQRITIFSESKNFSNVIGHKKENIKHLKNKYGFKDIRVKPGENLNCDGKE